MRTIRGTSFALVLLLSACSVTQRPPRPGEDAAQSSRLQELSAERSGDGESRGYRIGAGDKVRISVARAEEMSGEYTVTEDGHVVLPLIGDVVAAGRTEEDLAGTVAAALRAQYLQSPEVIVAVSSFLGKKVTVTGAVARPGFYELKGGRETILDLLTRAGGITEDASPKIYFSPAAPGQRRVAMAEGVGVQPAALIASPDQKPIELDLTDLYQGTTVPALQLPVRSGDVIYVKEGGQVYVQGWVGDPKSYPLKRAMTLSQAVAKAGGLHFGASAGSVMLSREDRRGVVHEYQVDFSALRGGAEKDIYLEPGDRIYVSGNPVKVGAWGVYNTLTSIIRFSIAGGVAAF